jgi:broad specificity phosphatase PhoE
MKIYLIRHGESTSDVENRYGGKYNDHLTEKGINQSKELAKKLTDKKIQIIFSSPYLRAKEMAEILKKDLNCDLQIIDNIRERNHYGILSGMEKDEAKTKYPKLAEELKDYKNAITGAEDYETFKKRIIKTFQKITNSKYNKIAIITHGGPIRCLFREFFKLGEFKDDLADCAIIEIEKENNNFKINKMDGAKLES